MEDSVDWCLGVHIEVARYNISLTLKIIHILFVTHIYTVSDSSHLNLLFAASTIQIFFQWVCFKWHLTKMKTFIHFAISCSLILEIKVIQDRVLTSVQIVLYTVCPLAKLWSAGTSLEVILTNSKNFTSTSVIKKNKLETTCKQLPTRHDCWTFLFL